MILIDEEKRTRNETVTTRYEFAVNAHLAGRRCTALQLDSKDVRELVALPDALRTALLNEWLCKFRPGS